MHDNQMENAGSVNPSAESNHIDGDELRKAVLARLPDLEEDHPAAEAQPSPNSGRLLSAGLSKKLLLGCGVALVLGAVVPLLLKQEDWKTRRPAPEADVAPTWSSETALVDTEETTAPSTDSDATGQPNVQTHDAASDDGMDMNIEMPNIPDLGMKPSADSNRSATLAGVAPTRGGMPGAEHASNRGYELPLQPGVARLDGTIEKISLRPTYDQSRPGVH